MNVCLQLSVAFSLNILLHAADDGKCPTQSTNADMAGPFWLANAPNRAILYDEDDEGIRIEISGKVTDLNCNALSGVYIDFWQASPLGEYDLDIFGEFKFRGGLYTNNDGEYTLYTLYPGIYGVRPRNIHAKVFIGGRLQFTTQIYFEGFVGSDSLFDPLRAIKLYPKNHVTNDSFIGTFDFIGDWINPSQGIETTAVYTTMPTVTGITTNATIESTFQPEETTMSDTTQWYEEKITATEKIEEARDSKSSIDSAGLSGSAIMIICIYFLFSF